MFQRDEALPKVLPGVEEPVLGTRPDVSSNAHMEPHDAPDDMTTQLEKGWLKYARDVIGCDDVHLKECRGFRPDWFQKSCLDDSIRWPGNLGSNYEHASLKILCLAQIHNEGRLAKTALDFEAVMRGFRNGSIGEGELLKKCRKHYERQIPTWGTCRFTDILPFRFTAADVAYANIAKCWAPARTGGLRVDNQPTMTSCNERFPIRCLVDLLEPDLIVQVGKCSALEGQLLDQERFVVANRDLPEDRADRAEKAKCVRERFGHYL